MFTHSCDTRNRCSQWSKQQRIKLLITQPSRKHLHVCRMNKSIVIETIFVANILFPSSWKNIIVKWNCLKFELLISEESLTLFRFFDMDKLSNSWKSGPYFIKVKIILSLRFKINLIFYLIIEFMKHSYLNFFYEIVNKITIKVKRN